MSRITGRTIPAAIGNRYKVITSKQVGKGSFGSIYRAIDKRTSAEYAAKFERRFSSTRLLETEMKIMSHFKETRGIPHLQYFGDVSAYTVLVMDMLGKNLDSILTSRKGHLSVRTVCLIGIQMFTRIQSFHSKNFIHRDIKPDNFLLGLDQNVNNVFMIDFGLSKKFIDHSGKHIPFKTGKELTGTPRYASINSHLGCETSRRDDLESICYVLLYFLKGRLPWQGINAPTDEKRYAKIGQVKLSLPVERLCSDTPTGFAELLNYSRGLGFTATPDYDWMKRVLLRELNNVTGQEHTLSRVEWLTETDGLLEATEKDGQCMGDLDTLSTETRTKHSSNKMHIGSQIGYTIDTPPSLPFSPIPSPSPQLDSSVPALHFSQTPDQLSPRIHLDSSSQPIRSQKRQFRDLSDDDAEGVHIPTFVMASLSKRRQTPKHTDHPRGYTARTRLNTQKPLMKANTQPKVIRGRRPLDAGDKKPIIGRQNRNGDKSQKNDPSQRKHSPLQGPSDTKQIESTQPPQKTVVFASSQISPAEPPRDRNISSLN
ncbi:putative Casein kinase I [Blattamonas nauphoetae]|uniref:non-specific serine/threonine protein kinase n=1 Tax=Blattamonas nauphoetae TaxID=2049346 RepID=A0ABQ9YFQ3_9EUKA|nr:putative Casein kinase I [Blattamonas nauphoetae]